MERLTKNTNDKPKTELELLNEINLKLDKLIGVLAIQSIEDLDDKIYAFKGLGFKEPEIKLFVVIEGRIRDREGWKRK